MQNKVHYVKFRIVIIQFLKESNMAFFRIKKLSEDEKEYYGEFEEKEQ